MSLDNQIFNYYSLDISPQVLIFNMDIGISGVIRMRFRTVSAVYSAETGTNREVSRFVSFLFFDFKKSQIRNETNLLYAVFLLLNSIRHMLACASCAPAQNACCTRFLYSLSECCWAASAKNNVLLNK